MRWIEQNEVICETDLIHWIFMLTIYFFFVRYQFNKEITLGLAGRLDQLSNLAVLEMQLLHPCYNSFLPSDSMLLDVSCLWMETCCAWTTQEFAVMSAHCWGHYISEEPIHLILSKSVSKEQFPLNPESYSTHVFLFEKYPRRRLCLLGEG